MLNYRYVSFNNFCTYDLIEFKLGSYVYVVLIYMYVEAESCDMHSLLYNGKLTIYVGSGRGI